MTALDRQDVLYLAHEALAEKIQSDYPDVTIEFRDSEIVLAQLDGESFELTVWQKERKA